jgi:ornithine cyclodeaminase/alanine dehydrogenase-like protein (mu-crystallin family)
MLILTRSDVKKLVPMSEAIELMKLAFSELSAGRAVAPVRMVVDVNHEPSMVLIMPAYVPAGLALGFKNVNFFGGNPGRNLPVLNATVSLIDDVTGVPIALMDGGYLTALRTGAVSGAATDLLARADSKTLVVVGAGVQGVTQAAAVAAVRPIERIIAVDQRAESLPRYRESIKADWPDLYDRVETTTDVADAVRVADVICLATTSKAAVFDDRDVKPGTHINGVGSFTPEMKETPIETIGRATIVVDSTEPILAEAGDLLAALEAGLISRGQLDRELGMVASGTAPGRTSDDEITFFKSVGNAVQDVVVARRAVDLANERGVGTSVDLTS